MCEVIEDAKETLKKMSEDGLIFDTSWAKVSHFSVKETSDEYPKTYEEHLEKMAFQQAIASYNHNNRRSYTFTQSEERKNVTQ